MSELETEIARQRAKARREDLTDDDVVGDARSWRATRRQRMEGR